VEAAVVLLLTTKVVVVLADQVAEQQIRQAEAVLPSLNLHLLWVAQVQQDREIQELQQIQEQVADSMEAVAVALALPEKQVLSKVTVVTVMHG
jgi:hypothetical protein